jgi:high-affinity nickel-transport protein
MPAPLIRLEESQPDEPSGRSWLKTKASGLHEKTPGIKHLPFSAVAIIVLLVFGNVAVWIAVGIVLVHHLSVLT